ncbi:MAG: RluA family pseudouridine synthase [Clostridia bacterium]|nr:RluA family pseudouridine synthase [Clostridia bacterium]
MREINAGVNDAGQRLDKFMGKLFPTMPQSLLYKYLRQKCVRVNGKHEKAEYKIQSGDVLRFYISEEFFGDDRVNKTDKLDKIKPSFAVIYEDENILIVDKPLGLLCQSDDKESFNTLDNHIRAYLKSKGEYSPENENAFAPSLCNRIDKNTQGLVIAAKNAEALRIMNDKVKEREIDKRYLCLVFGVPKPSEGVFTAYLYKDNKTNTVTVSEKSKPYNKDIKTGYKTLRSNGKISLLEVRLFTGRTHQIRAHMAYLGHPLLGDGKYGSAAENKEFFKGKKFSFEYQALCSYKLTFEFTSPSGILEYLNGKTFETKPYWGNDLI